MNHSFITLFDQTHSGKQRQNHGNAKSCISTNYVSTTNADTSALERQIDEMVYKLYGLTCLQATHRQAPEEIALVEGKG